MRRLTLRFILAVLALLTLSRLGLAFWQWDRVQAAGGWPRCWSAGCASMCACCPW